MCVAELYPGFGKKIHEECCAFSATAVACVHGYGHCYLGQLVPPLTSGGAPDDAGLHDCGGGFLRRDSESNSFLLGTVSEPIR